MMFQNVDNAGLHLLPKTNLLYKIRKIIMCI